MNAALSLAIDFLERASDVSYGKDTNEAHALRWAILRSADNPIRALNLDELSPNDVDAMPRPAWLWLASALEKQDAELPAAFVDNLFNTTKDPVIRLLVAGAVLRHPGLAQRYTDAGATFPLQPPSWAKGRLLALIERDDSEGNGLTEMVLILIQIGNEPSMKLLRALDHERRDTVNSVLGSLAPRVGASVSEFRQRLELGDG